MEPELTRLATIDPETQGVRVKLAGGEYRGDDNEAKKKEAAAMIDFTCDPDRSGLEGLVTEEDSADADDEKRRRDENKSEDRSLQFKSFELGEDDTYVLKLDWRTRYACDDYQRGKQNNSNSWGFFTWMIIM